MLKEHAIELVTGFNSRTNHLKLIGWFNHPKYIKLGRTHIPETTRQIKGDDEVIQCLSWSPLVCVGGFSTVVKPGCLLFVNAL